MTTTIIVITIIITTVMYHEPGSRSRCVLTYDRMGQMRAPPQEGPQERSHGAILMQISLKDLMCGRLRSA